MADLRFKNSDKRIAARNILCIGRNYRKHAEELGNKVPSSPVVFMKPVSSIIQDGGQIELPAFSEDVHYETELVLLIGKKGKNIPQSEAMAYIEAYGVGLDLTARDVQSTLKEKGLPWTIAKGFDSAACLSSFVDADAFDGNESLHFSMLLNGETKQTGDTSYMIFSIPYLISYLSSIFTLDEGDIIFTGTPEGVGPLHTGDAISVSLEDLTSAEFKVA
jgi:2-keto-4-pentenoate hydratase/2-oxohepta-3-ene-1,7-dioic acid hydratase in catechol pathway